MTKDYINPLAQWNLIHQIMQTNKNRKRERNSVCEDFFLHGEQKSKQGWSGGDGGE